MANHNPMNRKKTSYGRRKPDGYAHRGFRIVRTEAEHDADRWIIEAGAHHPAGTVVPGTFATVGAAARAIDAYRAASHKAA